MKITVHDLREFIVETIRQTSRASEAQVVSQLQDISFSPMDGELEDEWLDDQLFRFVIEGSSLEESSINVLTDPYLHSWNPEGKADPSLFVTLNAELMKWMNEQSWAAAAPARPVGDQDQVVHPDIWVPTQSVGGTPPVEILVCAPACVLLAEELLREGRPLHEIGWREFEDLIVHLLRSEGWEVLQTPRTRDGGVDVIAVKDHPTLGAVRSVWQAKCYSQSNKVRLHQVRELAAVRTDFDASKAFVVTTSALTPDALKYVTARRFQLGAKQGPDVINWLSAHLIR